jgi:hypothetical protein
MKVEGGRMNKTKAPSLPPRSLEQNVPAHARG